MKNPLRSATSFTNENVQMKLAERKIEAIVIGASAGGIQALLTVLPALPASYAVPIIVVVHMPNTRDSRLVDVFQYHMAMKVAAAEDKSRVLPGCVYFAAPGYHLSIETDRSFSLSCEEPVHYSRPAIDVLMLSAADAYGESLLGILLTGANKDGAEGMARIHEVGGLTVVQDPLEAEVPAMPQAALNLFVPDFILSLRQTRELIEKVEMV
jgi:two-component system chemotaxis response regulator CheB